MKKYLIPGLGLSLIMTFTACKKENPVDLSSPVLVAKEDLKISGKIGPDSTEYGVCLGNLTNYLFVFANGSEDANWQGATKGFMGDVAVNGLVAGERTSGGVPYAGTLFTNATSQGNWQGILNQNASQSNGMANETGRIDGLVNDLNNAFGTINDKTATIGFEGVTSTSLNGLNTQNSVNETFVINITSGMSVSSKINITGDAGDLYILRWDNDGDPFNGYQGTTKFQSGGAIVPNGGLKATNFVNVAGNISSSGGGNTPALPYPQGPRYNDGQGNLIINGSDFNGGGFFTGYWLTTGNPDDGKTSSLSNAIFVGGWFTTSTKFSMTSGTSGVYVSPAVASTCRQ